MIIAISIYELHDNLFPSVDKQIVCFPFNQLKIFFPRNALLHLQYCLKILFHQFLIKCFSRDPFLVSLRCEENWGPGGSIPTIAVGTDNKWVYLKREPIPFRPIFFGKHTWKYEEHFRIDQKRPALVGSFQRRCLFWLGTSDESNSEINKTVFAEMVRKQSIWYSKTIYRVYHSSIWLK